MDVEREIQDLKRRVGDLEGAINVLAGQFGSLQPELVGFKEATRGRFDTLDDVLGRIGSRLDTVNTQVWSLRDDFPVLMAEAMRKSRRDLD